MTTVRQFPGVRLCVGVTDVGTHCMRSDGISCGFVDLITVLALLYRHRGRIIDFVLNWFRKMLVNGTAAASGINYDPVCPRYLTKFVDVSGTHSPMHLTVSSNNKLHLLKPSLLFSKRLNVKTTIHFML
jgi:hypothetical protein